MDLHSLFNDIPDISGILLAAVGAAVMFAPDPIKWLEGKRKIRYALAGICLLVGILGMISGHVQRILADKSQQTMETEIKSLHTQVSQLVHNTEQPPQVTVNAPSQPTPRPVSRGFIQLAGIAIRNPKIAADSKLSVNIGLINKGTEPIENLEAWAAISVDYEVSDKSDTRMVKKFRAESLKVHRETIKSGWHLPAAIGVGAVQWNTFTLPSVLTQSQADAVINGRARLYVYSWAHWKNAKDDYEICEWMQAPQTEDIDNSRLVWHMCEVRKT